MQDSGYSGHSFRWGAAQHASDIGMLDSEIQTLGRWSSTAFQLYFTLHLAITATQLSIASRHLTIKQLTYYWRNANQGTGRHILPSHEPRNRLNPCWTLMQELFPN